MTTLVTRARLLSTVLRTGDVHRIGRLVDRIEAREFAGVLPALDHLDLRRLASALCDADHVQQTVDALDTQSLARLALAASPEDLRRLLRTMVLSERSLVANTLLALPQETRERVIERADDETRHELIRALPRRARPKTGDEGLVAALRLRRLFA